MSFFVSIAIGFFVSLIGVPALLATLRFFGLYAVVDEGTCHVYTLFGNVIGELREPGLVILPTRLGVSAFVVRLLGKGELKAKLNFTVAGASKSAVAAVEKAGGTVTIPEVVPAAEKAKAKHRTVQKARAADKEAKKAAAKA